MAKVQLDWKNDGVDVDTDNLSPELAKLYAAEKAAGAKYKDARDSFEAAFIQAARKAKFITAEQTFAFGRNFGKLRVVPTGIAPATTAKATKGMKL